MRSTTYIPAVLATLSLTHARVLKRDLVVQTLDNWSSLGCYSDTQSSRTLSVAAHFGEHVSDTNCQYQCQQLGYAYAGTEYSGQCYCDNTVNTVATQKPASDCNMACTGDNTQPCGGPDRINLFWNGTTTAAPPTPITAAPNAGIDGWSSVGCYTDDVGNRGLPVKVSTAGGASQMTIQTCVDACYAAGYTLAGAEYANECYCGNAIQNGQSLASDQSTCSMACKGDPSSVCGGPGRMNLYSYGGAAPSAASVTPSATPTSVKPTLPTGWTALGCYSDTNGKRALSSFFNEPSSGMTVEYCVSKCSAAGFSIAGVEYGGECYCDNTIQNNQGLASNGDAGCNMPCHGNAGEMCGGPNRLNVYASGAGWTQLGCFSDQNYQRTLAVTASYPGDLTVEKCLSTCHAAGYAYSGVEYGNECHCGSSFDNGGGPASDGSAGCSFSCAGNSSEICGGANRLSLYAYINADGSISSTASTPSGTTGSTAASPTAETSNIPSGWQYDSCYTDQTNGRILAHQQPDSSSLTASQCISACAASGYSVAGLEYSSQCFCDNAIQNGGSLAPAGKCTMTCSGDSSKTCGGPGVMDVYSTGPLQSASVPTAQTTGLPTSWSYDNCYADSVGARVFSVEVDQPNTATASTCISYCSGLGYPVAAIEYADQCFCGTLAQRSAATLSNQCSMTCAGDSTKICGGPGAMSLYVQN